MKKLPIKRKSAVLRKKPAPKRASNNQPPAVTDAEIKLCMAGKWKEAAKAHCARTGIMYRRSLVAVASVYRKHLQAVLAAIESEFDKER